VRDVTLWDVSCERQVQISGPDAARFVQWLTPRNLAALAIGQAKYVPLVDGEGGMINDPLLLRIEESLYWLSLADSDVLLWAKGLALDSGFDVRLCEPDVSPLQLQGPKATAVMRDVVGDWVLDLKYFWLRETEIDGIPVVVSRTGWSNERGYEIFLRDGSRGDELWERFMSAGAPYNIHPACPSQIKRMEAGLLSYHNDMNLANNPFELGLERFVDLGQEAEFIGKAALRKIAREGVKQRLLGAEISGDPLPVNEHRWRVLKNGSVVGELTSQVYSPSLERNIAYVMVPVAIARAGESVTVETVDGLREATLRELPFVDNRAAGTTKT
jgi:aminomethyltransferase